VWMEWNELGGFEGMVGGGGEVVGREPSHHLPSPDTPREAI
jgi:hypothetical protein